MQHHPQRLDAACRLPQLPGGQTCRHPIKDPPRHEFGGGVLALELRVVVQVALVEAGEDGAQGLARQTDVYH